MKTKSFALKAGAACMAFAAGTAMAASQLQINTSIDLGLGWLASTQASGGYWNYGGYEQAATGAAVFGMLSQKARWGGNAAAYQADVDAGIAYLLSTASTMPVSTRNDGASICPGGGSCTGVYWYGSGEATYTTGQVAMAIAEYGKASPNAVATTSGPLAGMTWKDIAQGVINAFSASQSSAINGNRDGGWRYFIPGNGDSDMSTTQWAVLSGIYGQSLGATVPQTVKDHLGLWLAATQAPSGVACYQPGTPPCDQADTGGLLLSLAYIGKTASDPAAQNALGWINSQWPAGASGTWDGNFGHPYSMWATYKGLELMIGLDDTTAITNLRSANCGGNSPTTCNWWQDYNEWLVNNQAAGGYWDGYAYWGPTLATAYYLPILSGAAIPVEPQPAPEPATLLLLAAGLLALSQVRRLRPAVLR